MIQRIVWYTLCGFAGLVGGFLCAEIIGAPLALLIPVVLVRFAKFHHLGAVATLLTYCWTFALVIFWAAYPAFFPSSFAYAADPSQTLAFAGVLLLIDALMASFAFLPAVRSQAKVAQHD